MKKNILFSQKCNLINILPSNKYIRFPDFSPCNNNNIILICNH